MTVSVGLCYAELPTATQAVIVLLTFVSTVTGWTSDRI